VALISLITIPLSLTATLLVLQWRGETINTMTLAGLVIALGAVVDDAIIDVRTSSAERSTGVGAEGSTASEILNASLEVRGPIIYATLIIVAAAVPVFLLQGLTGAFFRPLALSYTMAIVASLLVALTITPALALLLLARSRVERRKSPVVTVLQRGYTAALSRIVARPVRAYAIFGLVSVAGIVMMPFLGHRSSLQTRKDAGTGSPSREPRRRRCARDAASQQELREGAETQRSHRGRYRRSRESIRRELISIDPRWTTTRP
jgi:Cu/Ag efflux pump CusA